MDEIIAAPCSYLLKLPRELRDVILQEVLRDVTVFIAQWSCSRSAILNFESLGTPYERFPHPTSSSISLDFFARSSLLHVNRQIRLETSDALREVGYHVYIASHCGQIDSFLLASPAVHRTIDALYLTNVCGCTEWSHDEDVYDQKYAVQRDKVVRHMPRLRDVYLVTSTSLAAIDLQMMGLYISFFDTLKENRLQSIYIECGVGKGNYAADVDYERSWLLGPPPRVRHRSHVEFNALAVFEIARRKAIGSWLKCYERPGYVNAYWPLPHCTESALRFILQNRKGSAAPTSPSSSS